MATKAWIIVELNNGRKVRYIRDITYRWRSGDSYSSHTLADYYVYNSGDTYGDTSDTWSFQGDSAGRIHHDMDSLTYSVALHEQGQVNPGGQGGDTRTWLFWPESAGDTWHLDRKNWHLSGDTEGDKCHIRTKIRTDAISSIFIEEIPLPVTTEG